MKRLNFWMFGLLLMCSSQLLAEGVPTKLTVDLGGFGLARKASLRGEGVSVIAEADANRRIVFDVPVEKEGRFVLSIATSENTVYLIPGEELYIELLPEDTKQKSYNLMRLDMRFKGTAAPINHYLNTFRMEMLPDSVFLTDQESYIAAMQKVIQRNRKAIGKYKLDATFKASEQLRAKYMALEALTRYPIQHYWKGGNQMGLVYDHGEDLSIVFNHIKSELRDDEMLWQSPAYRKFVGSAIGILTGFYGHRDWAVMFRDRLATAKNYFQSKTILEDFVHNQALTYVESTESNTLGDLQAVYDQYVQKPAYKAELQKAMATWDSFAKGAVMSTSEEAAYVDMQGNKVSLSDFKGKYLYIDVWATWCGPCRAEIPFLKALEEKFHGRNIHFVSISVDTRKSDWARMVERDHMTGIQLYGGQKAPIISAYKIDGIPRFFLVDREGRIISSDMSRPSDPATEKALNELEGI